MEHTIGQKVGAHVKAQRKALCLTQEDLERLSGVPQGTISRLEMGKHDDLQVSTLLRLAHTLQFSIDAVLGVAGAEAAAPLVPPQHPSRGAVAPRRAGTRRIAAKR
jgi:transcriptional regulator with XRE-family HTH domain